MKRNRPRPAHAAFLALFFACAFFTHAQAPSTGPAPVSMTVQVAKSSIREFPSAVAPVLATVEYRAKVLFYSSKDGWAKVQVPNSTRFGFMFLSALAVKSIPPGGVESALPGVSNPEIALAGKGFNASIEDSYKKSAHVDYSWVDAMESFGFSPEICAQFVAGRQ